MLLKSQITIRTPKGCAKSTASKLERLIIGRNKINKVETTKEDDTIIWIVETDYNGTLKIQRNVMLFDKLIKMTLQNKYVAKLIKKQLSKEDQAQLDDMLLHHTKSELKRTGD